jgi:hypothetical protein
MYRVAIYKGDLTVNFSIIGGSYMFLGKERGWRMIDSFPGMGWDRLLL